MNATNYEIRRDATTGPPTNICDAVACGGTRARMGFLGQWTRERSIERFKREGYWEGADFELEEDQDIEIWIVM
jgi:hypothetical protein